MAARALLLSWAVLSAPPGLVFGAVPLTKHSPTPEGLVPLPQAPRLYPRDSAGITESRILLQAASGLSTRSARETAFLLGFPSVCVLVTLLWAGLLRRQVRAQTELIRKERNLLSTLVDHLPDNVFVKNASGRFMLTNRAHARFHGFESSAELAGKLTADVCAPDIARAYLEVDEKILRGELASYEAEEPARNALGEVRCLSTIKVPLKDQGGQIIGLVGISRDITERKRNEDALRQSERFTRSLVEHLPQNILHKDLSGQFTFVNDYFCRTVNRPMEQILGKTDFDLYPPELAGKFREDDREVIARGTLFRTVEENRNAAGEITYVEVIKSPLPGPDGRPCGLQVIFWDVTPQKKAESQLAYERDLLKALLDNYPDAIYFKDLESRFVRVSRSKLERAFAVARSRHHALCPSGEQLLPAHLRNLEEFSKYLIGRTDYDFFEESRARSAFEDEQEIIRTGRALVGKIESAVLPDGKLYWSLSTKMPWRDPSGRIIGTFGISKDITAIKEAEETLAAVHRQLVETSRQAGMAEVATGVLHNVGNVLNSVNVSASLLADKVRHSKAPNLSKVVSLIRGHNSDLGHYLKADPRGRQLPTYLEQLAERLEQEQAFFSTEIQALAKNIDHIKHIVTMQQTYARAAGVSETVQPAELLEEALRLNADSFVRSHIEIHREFQPELLPGITIEKHKVLQILVNLLRNAVFACLESAHPKRQIAVGARTDSEFIRFSVVDNGVGIAAENLAKIFNLGFTTRKDGHGFGLHSSALAARELGGALSAQSEGPGRGATFLLELPLRPNSP